MSQPTYAEHPFPPSLWCATAASAPDAPGLEEDVSTDVAIVGAGFTGLSTALHLAEKRIGVCVLDAEQPGWGASGRNGGQVIPGLKYDPDELVARFGPELGEQLINLAGTAADHVFELIDRYGMDCQAVRKGWIQTAHSEAMLRIIEKRVGQWARRGAPIELLDRATVSARIGNTHFVGGWIDHRAGSVQPLSYAYELARAGQALGARIHGHSRVVRLEKHGQDWRLTTVQGTHVRARRVLLATNAYTDDLWPGLRQTVLAANSFLVATRPLEPGEGGDILPGGEVTSDSRRLLVYFRRDAAGRLVLGGRGPLRTPRDTAEWAHIERALTLLFPHLRGISLEYRWAGRIAMTRDFLPHLHEPAPGLNIVLGYNGRGVALATQFGKLMANYIEGDGASAPGYPITKIQPIPFHGLQRLYMAAGVTWYRILDALS